MPIDKRVRSAAEALADVADGATVFITGFGIVRQEDFRTERAVQHIFERKHVRALEPVNLPKKPRAPVSELKQAALDLSRQLGKDRGEEDDADSLPKQSTKPTRAAAKPFLRKKITLRPRKS